MSAFSTLVENADTLERCCILQISSYEISKCRPSQITHAHTDTHIFLKASKFAVCKCILFLYYFNKTLLILLH